MSPPAASNPAHDHSAPVLPAGPPGRVPAPEIDASCRGPLLLLFSGSLVWLVLGLVLALMGSIQLHAPGFLASAPWLTVGRIRPASMAVLRYGFASQAALGVLLWLLCRLGRVRLPAGGAIGIAGLFWNLGVALGVLMVLGEGGTGFEALEMPGFTAPILFVAFVIIGLAALAVFHGRRERELYPTQWYLVAALFWFPWIYSAATLLLLYRPVRGVLQAAVDAWFTNNLFQLWFAQLCLGAVFYFIPKLLARPLYSGRLAAFGFWSLAFFANWTGLTQAIGGPLPAWMVSTSVAASLVLVAPVLAVALNWHFTLRGAYRNAWRDLTLRFILWGAAAYLLAAGLGLLMGFPAVSELTHFTYAEVALKWFNLLGFVAMVLFGSLYYILPRLLSADWPSMRNIRLHFWCSAGGSGLLVLVLLSGGLLQGWKMNLGTADFITLGKVTAPFVGLASLSLLVVLAGQLFLLANLAGLWRRRLRPAKMAAQPGRNRP